MSPTQWAALRYLHRTPDEAHTPLHLARYLGVTPGPASRTVASLERRGFVTRRRNPFDGRSVLIELTELGQRLLEEDPIERLAIAVDGLDADQRRVLEASLESIAGLLSAPVKEDADGRDTGD